MFRFSTTHLIGIAAAVFCHIGASSVCEAGPNAVQTLQNALEDGDSIMELSKQVNQLKTVSELLAASQLTGLASRDILEPLDPARGKNLAELLDNRIRKPLLDQIRLIANKGSALSKQALATRIAEMKIMTSGFHHPNAQKRYRDFILALSHEMESLILSKNEQPKVREAAAMALGRILVEPKSATDALASLFSPQRSVDEKRAAADAINEMIDTHTDLWLRVGSSNNMLLQKQTLLDLVDQILKLSATGLAEQDLEVRKKSLEAMGEISGRLEGASLLRVPPVTVADIQNVKAGEPELQPILKDFNLIIQTKPFLASLTDPDSFLRLHSRILLEQLATIRLKIFLRQESIAAKDRPEVDLLIEGLLRGMESTLSDLNDPNAKVRLAGVEFLERLGLSSDAANLGLTASLRDVSPFVRWSAARALGRIGYKQLQPFSELNTPMNLDEKSLRQVTEGLAFGLDDRDVDVRTAVANIISVLAYTAQSAKSDEVRARAVGILQNAVPSLIAASAKGDGKARIAALKSLYYTGVDNSQAEQATSTLITVLNHPESVVRRAAAETLGSFGKAAASAMPALQQALQDSDGEVRKSASDALLQIMP